MVAAPNTSGWALRYLQGRADAYRRGRLTIANVAGAVQLALTRGVTEGDITELLRRYALSWEIKTRTLSRTD